VAGGGIVLCEPWSIGLDAYWVVSLMCIVCGTKTYFVRQVYVSMVPTHSPDINPP
jgi:hypothetical protein